MLRNLVKKKNKEKRDEIVLAGRKIGAILNEANDTRKLKESLFGIAVDEFKNKNQEKFNLIKEENLNEQQRLKIATDLVTNFLRGLGYVGRIPEVNLTSEENGRKMIYYINGVAKSREGVKVIVYDGKIQSMMPYRIPIK